MTKKISTSLILSLLLCHVGLAQTGAENAPLFKPSKYEQLLARLDTATVTKSYSISKVQSSGYEAVANMAYTLGLNDKIFAVSINGQSIDFEHLKDLQNNLTLVIDAINQENAKNELTAIHFRSATGISVSYYSYESAPGKIERNIYLTLKGTFLNQGALIEPLVKLRDIIGQARGKLIALGAKE